MTRDRLFDAIGGVSDALLLRAEYRRRHYMLPAVAAAILILTSAILLPYAVEQRRLASLPRIPLTEEMTSGMGYEAYYGYSIEEIVRSTPSTAEALPVYYNAGANPYWIYTGMTDEETRSRLTEIAEKLEVRLHTITEDRAGETYRTDTGYLVPPETLRWLEAEGDDYAIQVRPDGFVDIRFTTPLPLPEGMSFTDVSGEDARASIDWIAQKYAALLNFKNYTVHIVGRRNTRGEIRYTYTLSDAEADPALAAIHEVELIPGEDNTLMYIRLHDYRIGVEELGVYPLITEAEAREILLSGIYLTNTPYGQPTAEQIVHAELTYRADTASKYWIPYYRFYVHIPEPLRAAGESEALNTYAAYYIPAVEVKYWTEA